MTQEETGEQKRAETFKMTNLNSVGGVDEKAKVCQITVSANLQRIDTKMLRVHKSWL